LLEVLEVYKDPSKIPVLVAVAEKSGSASLASQLEELGTSAAKALMASFGESCEAKYARLVGVRYARWVGEMIGEMDDQGLTVLVEGFRSDVLCQQFAAVEGLKGYYYRNCKDAGDRAPDPGVQLFEDVATSEDPKVSDAAIRWINSQQIKEGTCVDFSGVVEPLIAAYQSNASSATMIEIAKSLSMYPAARVTRFMRAAVHAPNPEIQKIATEYLATYAAPPARTSRAEKAPRTSAEKVAAAEKWGRSEDTNKTIALADLLRDADPKVASRQPRH